MLRTLLAAIALVLTLAGGARAQDSAATTAPPTTAAPHAVADTSEMGPVAVPPATETALRYHRSGNVLWAIGTIWGLLVPAAILFTGLSARIRTRAQRITGGRWFLTIAVYVFLLSVLLWLVNLPLSYYAGFVREH
ncbi:MAG TPA: hypothetical protein VFQ39_15755, partial [Longimicrobium sp.]|nr:hypothetical protein [Longimicrobium sp.]